MPEAISNEGALAAVVFAVGIAVAIAWLVLPFTIQVGIKRMNKTLERIETLLRQR